MVSSVLIVIILVVALSVLLLWWFWPTIKSWCISQKEPFNDFLQKLHSEVMDSDSIKDSDTVMDSSENTNSHSISYYVSEPDVESTTQSVESTPPIIDYRSEEFTSEPVITKELIHQFRIQPGNNNKYFYEEQCRQIFEQLFPGHVFVKARPAWLINPRTNHALELDGYNEELKLAFEYNGPQHYQYPNRYHRSETEWLEQKYRDLVKRQICNQRGVYLITIPYHVPRHHLRSFITRYVSYYRRLGTT